MNLCESELSCGNIQHGLEYVVEKYLTVGVVSDNLHAYYCRFCGMLLIEITNSGL